MEKQNVMNYKAKRISSLERRVEALEKNKEHMLKEDKEWVENFEGVIKELQALKNHIGYGLKNDIILDGKYPKAYGKYISKLKSLIK